ITNHSDPDVPDGVYIDEAFMNKATITELIANTVTADYVNAIDLNAISISGGEINIANKFTVAANGGVIARNLTVMNANGQVLLSSNANTIDYAMVSGGPPQNAQANDYNYNNLFNRPSIPSSIADIDGDGIINQLELNVAVANSEALAHAKFNTYYGHITNSQGGVTGQYVGDSSYKYVDFYLPSAGMVSVFVRGVSLGSGQRVEIRNTNSNSWTLMGTIPNLDSEYRTYSADMYINGSGNYQVRVGGNGASNNWYVLSSIKVVRIGDVDKTDYGHIGDMIEDSAFDPSEHTVSSFSDWVSSWKTRADNVLTSAYIDSIFTNKIFAASVYAHKLSGDVYESVTKRYTGSYQPSGSSGSTNITLFSGSMSSVPADRVFEVQGVALNVQGPSGWGLTYSGYLYLRLDLYIDGVFRRTSVHRRGAVNWESASDGSFGSTLSTEGFFDRSLNGVTAGGFAMFEPLVYEHISANGSHNYEVRLNIGWSGWDHGQPTIEMFNNARVSVFMQDNNSLT
ncbi:MAG: hypothetical protein GY881_02530, partial [Gammaproteobacteria bacterium]|nr:hypothetical protein [Gammaproteobacteria bacterium]